MSLGEEPTPDELKTLLIWKICFIFVIFGIALGFGILPAKVKSCGRNPKFMSMANAFSGGLFLAIALIHILPDVLNEYTEYLHPEPEPVPPTPAMTYSSSGHRRLAHGDERADFPLPFILVFCGYTFILLVDKVMFDSHALFGGHDHGGGHGHGHGEEEGHGHGHEHGKKEHGHGHGHEHGKKEHGNHEHKHGNPIPKGHEHQHDHTQCLIQHESVPTTQNYLADGKDYYTDPAAAKLINNIKRSMIEVSNEVAKKTHGNGQLEIMEEKMIKESV